MFHIFVDDMRHNTVLPRIRAPSNKHPPRISAHTRLLGAIHKGRPVKREKGGLGNRGHKQTEGGGVEQLTDVRIENFLCTCIDVECI